MWEATVDTGTRGALGNAMPSGWRDMTGGGCDAKYCLIPAWSTRFLLTNIDSISAVLNLVALVLVSNFSLLYGCVAHLSILYQ